MPSQEDYFFTLLYHMIIHKRKINLDYSLRLFQIAPKIILENYSEKDFKNFEILKKILEKYMEKNGYRHTSSLSYRLSHNEPIRLVKVGIFTVKHEGWNFLFRAIKSKIRRSV